MTTTINASNSGSGGLVQTADASGVLALQTAGTTAVTIDTSQNVGIGTSSPGTILDVRGNSPTIKVLATNLSGATTSLELWASAAGNNYKSAAIQGINYGQLNLQTPSGVGVNSFITFATTATERMRIDSSGNLLVGKTTTSTATAGFVASATGMSAANTSAEAANFNRQSSDGTLIIMRRADISVGTISVTASATAYNTSSDYRLKEDIAPMTGALAKVAALKPVTYKWKVDGSNGEGFIAHELAEVCAHAVSGEKDAVDADGNPQYQGVDVSFLVATLTAAIQEQQAIITSLTARIAALEGQTP